MTIRDYPLLPIRNGLFFPGSSSVLHVGRPSSVRALRAAMASSHMSLALMIQKDPFVEEPAIKHLYPIGVKAVILEAKEQLGTFQVVVESQERIKLRDLSKEPFPVAQVEVLKDLAPDGGQGLSLHSELQTLSRHLFHLSDAADVTVSETAAGLQDPYELVNFLATVLPLSLEEGITVLQAENIEDGQRQILKHISRQIRLAKEKESPPWGIRKVDWSLPEVESSTSEEEEDREPDFARMFADQLSELRLPGHIRSAEAQLIDKLEHFEMDSTEHQSALMVLEYFFELPWNIVTVDNLEPAYLMKVLDRNLTGLERVKRCLLEQVCLDRLGPGSKGILSFRGPVGSGKRSTVEALAKALGRRVQFLRLPNDGSLSELSGRLWNSNLAGPGLLFEAIRNAGCQNPILVFPTDILTEAQLRFLVGLTQRVGTESIDDFLGLPLDFSECSIIVLSNSIAEMPDYLMEDSQVIDFFGYTSEQKEVVAREHLLPKLLDFAGLEHESLDIPDSVLRTLVESRSNERGLLGLKLILNTLVGKAALHKARGHSVLRCTEVLAQEVLLAFPTSRLDRETAPGQVRALTVTSRGGEVVEIESLVTGCSGDSLVTGLEDLRFKTQ